MREHEKYQFLQEVDLSIKFWLPLTLNYLDQNSK
jgi:hypothetical protein